MNKLKLSTFSNPLFCIKDLQLDIPKRISSIFEIERIKSRFKKYSFLIPVSTKSHNSKAIE
jgi:hypothetical protein